MYVALYVTNAETEGCNKFLKLTNITDAGMYLLTYFNQFKKIWVKFVFKEDQHQYQFSV